MSSLLETFGDRREPAPSGRAPRAFLDATPVSVDLDAELSGAHLDLHDTLLGRRSSLHYDTKPVSTRLILGLLRRALARDVADWQLDDAAGPVEAFVFALRSANLPAGVYRVTADGQAFIAPVTALGDPENIGVQREFSTAAGIVTVYGGLDMADAWAGSHGYRICVIRAAMALYDFHLGCQSHGLSGTLFGGFIASSVRNLVHSDGVTRHPLLSSTYGAPVESA